MTIVLCIAAFVCLCVPFFATFKAGTGGWASMLAVSLGFTATTAVSFAAACLLLGMADTERLAAVLQALGFTTP